MKKYIVMFGLTLVMGLIFHSVSYAQSTWGANPTTNPFNLGIGTLAPGDQAIDVWNATPSNIRVTRSLPGNGAVGRLQILNYDNDAMMNIVLRRQGGNDEMIQSARDASGNWLEYLYLNLDTRKYEIREGIGLAEWLNEGDVLFNNTGGIGVNVDAIPAGFKLAVNGKVIAEELKIQLKMDWPDFVFNNDYNLMPLNELESFVTTNRHLPGVLSEAAINAQGGFNVGETSAILLQKIEELTLYIIELNKRIEELEK